MKTRRKGWLLRTVLLMMLLLAAVPVSASAKISISNKKFTLAVGQTFPLTLNGLTGEEQSIVWKVRRKAVADISQDGVVTAKQEGVTKIYAVVDGIRCRSKLTVTQSQSVTSISLNKTARSLVKGKHFRLKVKVEPEDAENKAVTWTSSDKTVAKVNAKGKVTAVGAGTASITAQAKDGSNVLASCTVTVSLEPVKLNMTQLTLKAGKKAKLKATEGYHYVWATSNKTIATVTKAGKVKGKSAGRAVIVAKRVEDGQSVFCYVVVTGSQPEDQTQTTESGPSARALQFLALMEKYSQKQKSDKAAGIRWIYGGACAHDWKEVQKQSKKGTVRLSCVQPAQWGLRELGIIGDGDFKGVYGYSGLRNGDFRIVDKEQFSQYCIVIRVDSTPEQLIKEGKLLPGDICSYVGFQHTNVYAGNGLFYDSGRAAGANGAYVGDTYVFDNIGPIKKNDLIGSIARIVK